MGPLHSGPIQNHLAGDVQMLQRSPNLGKEALLWAHLKVCKDVDESVRIEAEAKVQELASAKKAAPSATPRVFFSLSTFVALSHVSSDVVSLHPPTVQGRNMKNSLVFSHVFKHHVF